MRNFHFNSIYFYHIVLVKHNGEPLEFKNMGREFEDAIGTFGEILEYGNYLPELELLSWLIHILFLELSPRTAWGLFLEMLTYLSTGIGDLGFSCGSAGKESTCNARDLGSIPGLGRSPWEGKGYRLQYSGLENSMDCTVCGVVKSQTRLSYLRTLETCSQRPHFCTSATVTSNLSLTVSSPVWPCSMSSTHRMTI